MNSPHLCDVSMTLYKVTNHLLFCLNIFISKPQVSQYLTTGDLLSQLSVSTAHETRLCVSYLSSVFRSWRLRSAVYAMIDIILGRRGGGGAAVSKTLGALAQ